MVGARFVIGALGLALAAAVRADVPKTVTILGKAYTVTANPRTGAFKNGVTVHLQTPGGSETADLVPHKANLGFAPGADAASDRLFVVAATEDADGVTSDGFYMPKGTDANGVFSPANSDATVLLSGMRNA